MRVRFISVDSDILDSVSKIVNQRGTMQSSKPLDRTWYSRSFILNNRDMESIKDFIGVYGYSLFKDKEDPGVFILKPLGEFLPNVECKIE